MTVREIEGATVKVAHDPPPPPRYIIRTYDPTMQEWCFDEMRDDKPDLTGLDSGFVAEIIDTRPDLRIGGQAKEDGRGDNYDRRLIPVSGYQPIDTGQQQGAPPQGGTGTIPATSRGEAVPVDAIRLLSEGTELFLEHVDHSDTKESRAVANDMADAIRSVRAWLSYAPQHRAKASEEVEEAFGYFSAVCALRGQVLPPDYAAVDARHLATLRAALGIREGK